MFVHGVRVQADFNHTCPCGICTVLYVSSLAVAVAVSAWSLSLSCALSLLQVWQVEDVDSDGGLDANGMCRTHMAGKRCSDTCRCALTLVMVYLYSY